MKSFVSYWIQIEKRFHSDRDIKLTFIQVAILVLVSAVYGIPVQETPEVAAARAAHNAAHATARALNAIPPSPNNIFLQQPVQDTQEVWAAKAEHYRVCITFIFESELASFTTWKS